MSSRYASFDGYGFRHLPRHLARVKKVETLREMLFGFDWLQAKLDATDVNALVADYDLMPEDAVLGQVQAALRLAGHVLAEDKRQLAGQLLGRLPHRDQPAIEELLGQARRWGAAPWLRPLTPSLASTGGPLLRTMTGHKAAINAVALTGDDRQAISAAEDGTLKVWDLNRGQEIHTLEGHQTAVEAVAVTPDGRRAISGAEDGTLTVWDLRSGQELRTQRGHDTGVSSVLVTPDGRQVISSSKYGPSRVWDLESGRELRTLPDHTVKVVITANGLRGISLSDPLELYVTLFIWDASPGADHEQDLYTLDGERDWFGSLVMSADERWTVSAALDGTLRVWDLERGRVRHTLKWRPKRDAGAVTTVDLSSDERVAVSSWSETLRVWDLRRRKLLYTSVEHSDTINAVVVTGDGRRAVSASADGTLKVWDLTQRKVRRRRLGHSGWVNAVVITEDSQRAISTSDDATLKVWDISPGVDRKGALHTLTGHFGRVLAVAITPDGSRAVSGSNDRRIRVWNLRRGKLKRTLPGHWGRVWAVAVTPDGQWAISGSDDKTLRAWDLEHTILWAMLNRERFTCFVIDEGEVFNKVWVTADGQRMISGSLGGPLKVWDLSPGPDQPELLCTISGSGGGWGDSVAVSSDGSRAVSAYGDRLKVWDLRRGEELRTLKGHTHEVSAVALTPDEGQAISGSDDGTLKVWDLHSGGELRSLGGHGRRINTVMATPDGWRAISIAKDWTLKVWDLQSGGLLAAFTGEDELTAGAVAPDGATVVVGEASGRVHLLRLEGFEERGAQGPSALGKQ